VEGLLPTPLKKGQGKKTKMNVNFGIGILGASVAFLGISILILSTLRWGTPMNVIKDRLSEKSYDRLYDGMFLSVWFGGFCVISSIIHIFLVNACVVLYISSVLFLLQALVAFVSAIIAFLPFKFWLKRNKEKKQGVKEGRSPS
jgi:hypothetical protein